jgi:hypothetical protein
MPSRPRLTTIFSPSSPQQKKRADASPQTGGVQWTTRYIAFGDAHTKFESVTGSPTIAPRNTGAKPNLKKVRQTLRKEANSTRLPQRRRSPTAMDRRLQRSTDLTRKAVAVTDSTPRSSEVGGDDGPDAPRIDPMLRALKWLGGEMDTRPAPGASGWQPGLNRLRIDGSDDGGDLFCSACHAAIRDER